MAVAGCSSSATPESSGKPSATDVGNDTDLKVLRAVTVTEGANADTAPTITVGSTPLSVTGTTVRILAGGSGDRADAKSALDARIVVVNGTSGKVMESTYEAMNKAVRFRLADPALLKGFVTGFTGLQNGTRALIAIPPSEGLGEEGNAAVGIGPNDTLLAYVDIRGVSAVLDAVTGDMKQPAEGLPTVSMDGANGPKISTPTGTPPADTVIKTLIEGTGKPVGSPASVLVQYSGFLWKDGSSFDSSWGKAPYSLAVGLTGIGQQPQVIKAWDTKLVGLKVGSRVMLVVPPKDGYGEQGRPPLIAGTDTLVFVIDILDAG